MAGSLETPEPVLWKLANMCNYEETIWKKIF